MRMKNTYLLVTLLFCMLSSVGYGQGTKSYLNGKYTTFVDKSYGEEIQFFVFSRAGNTIKAKYFAQDAPQQYDDWKKTSKP